MNELISAHEASRSKSIGKNENRRDGPPQHNACGNCAAASREVYLPVSTGNAEVPLCSQGMVPLGLSSGFTLLNCIVVKVQVE